MYKVRLPKTCLLFNTIIRYRVYVKKVLQKDKFHTRIMKLIHSLKFQTFINLHIGVLLT